MFPIMFSTKIAQTDLLHWAKWLPELYLNVISFWTTGPKFIHNNFTEMFLIMPSTKIAQSK